MSVDNLGCNGGMVMLLNSKQSISELIKDDKVILCGEGDMIKANVDIIRERVHIGLAVHSDMETEMIKEGSVRGDLVGLNVFVDQLEAGEMITKDMLEFSSMINYDINRMRLNDLRSGYWMNDIETQSKVIEVLNKWLVQ